MAEVDDKMFRGAPGNGVPLYLAFAFGVLFLAALLILAVAIPRPTAQQFTIFRIVIALAGAGAAAVIPGFLDLRLSKGAGFAVRAGGALAVFIVLYFFSPAGLVAEPASAKTTGSQSPIIQGNSGNSTVTYGQTGNATAER